MTFWDRLLQVLADAINGGPNTQGNLALVAVIIVGISSIIFLFVFWRIMGRGARTSVPLTPDKLDRLLDTLDSTVDLLRTQYKDSVVERSETRQDLLDSIQALGIKIDRVYQKVHDICPDQTTQEG